MNDAIQNILLKRVKFLKLLGLTDNETTDEKYSEVFSKMYQEQEEKLKISDNLIAYNDEITEIEYIGEMETIDISVTGDSLFYCNGILTKNSIGLAATSDFICSVYQLDEDRDMGIIRMGLMKNRFGPNFGSSAFSIEYPTLSIVEDEELNSMTDESEDARHTLEELSK